MMARRMKLSRIFQLIGKLSAEAEWTTDELHGALREAGVDAEEFTRACFPKQKRPRSCRPCSVKAMRIMELLKARKSDGSPYNHTEIGRDDSVQCSHEYVRQVAWFRLGETGRERQREIAAIRRKPMKERAFPRGKAFIHLIRQWLSQISHDYCCQCHGCVPLALMTKGRGRRCKACSAVNSGRWYHTPEGKAKRLAWQRANKERCKGYCRAYWHRRKERLQNAEVS